MKTFKTITFLMILGFIVWSCKDSNEESILPKIAINDAPISSKLRPVGVDSLPDLTIPDFYINGAIVLVGADFKIPIKIIEKNIGTKIANTDTIFVFQRMPTALAGIYTNRLTGNLFRSTTLSPSASQTLTGYIYVPKKYINASTRKINLWAKADGGNTVTELSETNNFSTTLWDIYMPIF